MPTEGNLVTPRIVPPLDKGFRPSVLSSHAFLGDVHKSGEEEPLGIAIERQDGLRSVFETVVFPERHERAEDNLFYVRNLVKALLWIWGGWKVTLAGPIAIGQFIQSEYSSEGERAFDADFMSNVYERPFTVETTRHVELRQRREERGPMARHLDGCRIGFDAGASDWKAAAVIEGNPVHSEEIVWNPKDHSDPQYHHDEIMRALRIAASHMPRVDAIGISAAGIYMKNRVRVASLFRGVPRDLFEKKVTNLFLDIRKKWGDIPLEVANDGDVTALAGSMSLNDTNVLGIALGSSEAGGYVDREGNITGWLSELAFVPIDLSPNAPVEEWSGDRGCGAEYLSQEAVIRLAPKAGIALDERQTSAEKLKHVQRLMAEGDERARKIYETIGCYMGYGIAYYADFYDIKHVLILGRVTSGEGGNIILERTEEVLRQEFPDLASRIKAHLPTESERRIGQAVAAASLPVLK